MGCSQSLISEENLRDRKIGRQLKKDYAKYSKIAKLLLLGAGESGKSTIVKQMKLLHPVNDREQAGFSPAEKDEAKLAIYANIIDSIVALLEATTDLDIPLENGQLRQDKSTVLEYANSLMNKQNMVKNGQSNNEVDNNQSCKDVFPPVSFPATERPPARIVKAIENLWLSSGVQQAYQRRNEFQLADSAAYFLCNVAKYTSENYVPSDQDILRTRVRTTGIVKIEFEYKSLVFHMFDVGGQRSERKKWIHCFDNVDCVLFVVAMSEYDQMLVEDRCVNRMHESLSLFEEIVNNEFFSEMPFIVFFNKKDLFDQKVRIKSIRVAFPTYQGGLNDVQESGDFIVDTFISQSKVDQKRRPMYPHFTTATDTDLVKHVFSCVADVILNEVLKTTGLQ